MPQTYNKSTTQQLKSSELGVAEHAYHHSSQESMLALSSFRRRWSWTSTEPKPGMVANTSKPNTQEVKEGVSEIQVNLSYESRNSKQKKNVDGAGDIDSCLRALTTLFSFLIN